MLCISRCIFVLGYFIVFSAAQQDSSQATIVQYENERTDPFGGYKFSYLTSDGSSRDEIGEIRNPGEENESLSVIGEYAYEDTNGHLVMVSYKADEEGYQILKSSLFSPLPEGQRQGNNNNRFTASLRNPSAGSGSRNSAFPNRSNAPSNDDDDDNGNSQGFRSRFNNNDGSTSKFNNDRSSSNRFNNNRSPSRFNTNSRSPSRFGSNNDFQSRNTGNNRFQSGNNRRGNQGGNRGNNEQGSDNSRGYPASGFRPNRPFQEGY